MNRRILAMGFGLASLMATAQAAQPVVTSRANATEIKSTAVEDKKTRMSTEVTVGGVPLLTYHPSYGMSPKEYGIRFGHGNGKGKTNRLRLSHNAKLKRR